MAQDEANLYVDDMKQMGQAFAMRCLAVLKTRARQEMENQRAQENLDLRNKIEQLQTELQNSRNLLQEAK